jgi:hypothetical protein
MRSDWAGLIRAEVEYVRSGEHGLDGSDQRPSDELDRVNCCWVSPQSKRHRINEHAILILIEVELSERCTAWHVVVLADDLWWVDRSSSEFQMSKRKRATVSKHANSTRIAAKAQSARQAVVRSPKHRVLRSGGAGATERPPKRHNDPQQDTLFVENPKALVETETALQDDSDQMRDTNSKKRSSFSSTGASVWAYQAKLLELGQANMQFAFEFAQRLATIRSPAEFPSVIAEFTSKRIAMLRKHSTELAELSTKRLITSTGQSDPNKACSW